MRFEPIIKSLFEEVKITPPCLPYEVYMQCPNCRKTVEAMTYEKIKER